MCYFYRKRHRNENSPSPRPSPKRRREHSPDSDAYNSGDEKNEKHRLLSQVVRPQDTRSVSPAHITEERPTRWKEEERKPDRKDGSRRYEEVETKERVSSTEKQREHVIQAESSKAKETDSSIQHKIDDREVTDKLHEDKTKKKMLKKTAKKKKEEEPVVEKSATESPPEEAKVFSPKKGQKKKNLEKKRKKGESDISDEESVQHSKKKKGPRTPPVIAAPVPASAVPKEEVPEVTSDKTAVIAAQSKDSTFSDWSDEDVPERTESSIPEKIIEEPIKKPTKVKSEKEDQRPSCVEEPPARKPAEQKRSSSISSNQSRTSSRLRSPSIDSVHRGGDDPAVRRKLLHGSSRDRERNRSIESSGERTSRIDQLKRGEPSRSNSSGHKVGMQPHISTRHTDRRDSRSHSSRRSSPESDRQVHSRSGSFDSRERAPERERYEHDRERDREKDRDRDRRDVRPREWDRETDKDWPRNRERLRERDRRRDFERDREKLLPDNTEKERVRLLDASLVDQKRTDTKERDGDKSHETTSRNTSTLERAEKDAENLQDIISGRKAEKAESFDGADEEFSKLNDDQSGDSVAGEEYEPISDGELEEILADDAEKKEDQHEDEKASDPLDVLSVTGLRFDAQQPEETKRSGAALLSLHRPCFACVGIASKGLAGLDLIQQVYSWLKIALGSHMTDLLVTFHTNAGSLRARNCLEAVDNIQLGALNMSALLRRQERASLLSNLGPCCKALCSRRDLAIRKQLVQNEKGTVKQTYSNPPLVDSELLRLSLRLFKRRAGLSQEKTDDCKLSAANKQPEVCVS
ncbi:hypothetical protein GDO81_005224 [Engystomops pustulosus]|uniref:Zinc finger CCCH domain-containing protein 13 n=1 Tax=Engystomops pustulosus TaxID=76066 RepID=A0AAV7CNR5_ENGPU|nr:hypothetical protein GDO81_005224 [Engystomops pustulosus]